jgi:RNA polymerase sigma factor (sigma-70 family)
MERSGGEYIAYEGHPSVSHEADDMALLRRYVDLGSESAFSELVRRHLSWVHATCRKSLRDAHMAEDAAQAVFIILARRAATISPQTRLSGWLFNTARFVVKDARKQEIRYRKREDVAREMAAERMAPQRAPLTAATQSALDDALAVLTERDRQALLMHFYEGLSLAEMAQTLGVGKVGV